MSIIYDLLATKKSHGVAFDSIQQQIPQYSETQLRAELDGLLAEGRIKLQGKSRAGLDTYRAVKRMGRSPRGPEPRTEFVAIRVGPLLLTEIQAEAKRQGVSNSSVIEAILRERLDPYKKPA